MSNSTNQLSSFTNHGDFTILNNVEIIAVGENFNESHLTVKLDTSIGDVIESYYEKTGTRLKSIYFGSNYKDVQCVPKESNITGTCQQIKNEIDISSYEMEQKLHIPIAQSSTRDLPVSESNELRNEDFLTTSTTTALRDTQLNRHKESEVHITKGEIFSKLIVPYHFVYALVLLNENKEFDHIFYIGETHSLADRLIEHIYRDKNKAKWEYFKQISLSRIRMIKLLEDTMGKCMIIEKLLIQYAPELGLELTNNPQVKDDRVFQFDIIEALKELIHNGKELKDGINANAVRRSVEKKEKNTEQKKNRQSGNVQTLVKETKSLSMSYLKHPVNVSYGQNNPLDFYYFKLSKDITENNVNLLKKEFNLNTSASIVDSHTIITNFPGTFFNMDEEQIKKMLRNEESAIAFAARIGVIKNDRKCEISECKMKLEKYGDAGSYRWRCTHKENRCQAAVTKDTFFEQSGYSLYTLLRLVYYFSKKLSNDEIIERLSEVKSSKKKLYFIINELREEIVVPALKNPADNEESSSDDLLRHFFGNTSIDHFGIILFWTTKYQPLSLTTTT